MGGFAADLLSKLGGKIASAAERGLFKSEGSVIGREINEFAGNQEWELNATPQGKIIKGYIEDAHKAELPILHKLDAPRTQLWNGIKADPGLSKQFDYAKAPMQDIHAHLSSTNHPLSQHSSQILAQSSTNAGKTLQDLGHQNNRQALLQAQQLVMGKNQEAVSPLIMSMLDSQDSTVRALGQRYADILSNEFRDKEVHTSFGKVGPSKGPESRTKVQLNKAFQFVNKSRELEGSKKVPLLDTRPAYTDQGTTERALTDVLRTTQTPAAALPHSSMEFNLAIAAPTKALVRAMIGSSKAESDKILEASHILAINDMDALQADIASRTGKIAQWTGSPTLGSILNKTFHIPGFNQLRRMQIQHAGAVGFQTAIYWAGKLKTGSRVAEAELRSMKIDPSEVIKQGGQLTEEQLKSAVYHFTDNTMFLKKGLNMPLAANKNWFMRSMYMYHFYIRNEAFFLQKTFIRMAKAGDMAGIARYIGVLGIAWPTAAPLLDSLETLVRTGSFTQAGDRLQDDYGKLFHPSDLGEWAYNYFGLLGHIGAMGTFFQYWNSVKNYGFLKQVVGPKIATPATTIQDAIQAGRGQSAAPVERDLLQLIPLVGKPLSHQLVPSQKEQPKYSPHHRGGRRKH